jgi:16S rRNA (guanine527-N7)-methyltransferase
MLSVLKASAGELGVPLTDEAAEKMLRVLDALDEWNQRMNLTAIRDRSQQLTKHLLDSLSVVKYLHGERLVDIGTGAGFPGLPLAIVAPRMQLTLLDSTAKKLKFIDHVCAQLAIPNVETVHSRAESFQPKERYDIVISRAIGPVETFVKWAGHLCVGGGRLLAMKGRYPIVEIGKLPSGWKLAAVHRLTVPGLDEERHLVEICRSHDKV